MCFCTSKKKNKTNTLLVTACSASCANIFSLTTKLILKIQSSMRISYSLFIPVHKFVFCESSRSKYLAFAFLTNLHSIDF